MIDELKVLITNLLFKSDTYLTIHTLNVTGLPSELKNGEFVKLIFGTTPTPKMQIMDAGIFSPMKFNQINYDIFVPWSSIIRIENKEYTFQLPMSTNEKINKPKRNLKLVVDNKHLTKKSISKDKKRNHLKLIK